MAFNSDPQNFEQYVRQSVEEIHRVPSDGVWEQLAERLDAYDGISASPPASTKTSGKLKMIAWPAISMLAAAAAWALLLMNGGTPDQQKTSVVAPQTPLVQHTNPQIPENPVNNDLSHDQITSTNKLLSQHTPTANHHAKQQVVNSIAHKQTNTESTDNELSPAPEDANTGLATDRLERIPLPNPWSKTLSFNYPEKATPSFFAEAREESLFPEENQKRRKMSLNLPRISLKSMKKGKDWDYQIGIVAASFASKNRVLFRSSEVIGGFGPRVFDNSEGELGVNAEWVVSERFRLGGGFRIARAVFHLNPRFFHSPFLFDLFNRRNLDIGDLKQFQSFSETYLMPQANFQGKFILNPSSRKTRFFSGVGIRWLLDHKVRKDYVVLLRDESVFTAVESQKQKPSQRVGFARAFVGMEWPFVPALRGQLSCFAQFKMPDLDLLDGMLIGGTNTGSMIGVEGAIYFTGNRGYFRRIR